MGFILKDASQRTWSIRIFHEFINIVNNISLIWSWFLTTIGLPVYICQLTPIWAWFSSWEFSVQAWGSPHRPWPRTPPNGIIPHSLWHIHFTKHDAALLAAWFWFSCFVIHFNILLNQFHLSVLLGCQLHSASSCNFINIILTLRAKFSRFLIAKDDNCPGTILHWFGRDGLGGLYMNAHSKESEEGESEEHSRHFCGHSGFLNEIRCTCPNLLVYEYKKRV